MPPDALRETRPPSSAEMAGAGSRVASAAGSAALALGYDVTSIRIRLLILPFDA